MTNQILIVAGDAELLDFFPRELERAGYTIIHVCDVAAALLMVVDSKPDIILLGNTLPYSHGMAVCGQLRAKNGEKSIPIIFVTPPQNIQTLEAKFHTWANDYLFKPFTAEELILRIQLNLNRLDVTQAKPLSKLSTASFFIHRTADVSLDSSIGEGTRIWNYCQIREGVTIGSNCIISKGVYVDQGVQIGNNVKIQNHVSVFHGVTIEDSVFVGPHVCFVNDLRPRAINPDGSLKSGTDWILSRTLIKFGASLGANATILCGVIIGKWAMVGSGAVVTHNIPDYALVVGNPARLLGYVCPCGTKLVANRQNGKHQCPTCKTQLDVFAQAEIQ